MRDMHLDLVSTYYPYGLLQDIDVLTESIEQIGYGVRKFENRDRKIWDALLFKGESEIVIHVAQVQRRWLTAARKHVLIPNQESFRQERAWALRFFDKILVKSNHSLKKFTAMHPNVMYTGFTSKDIFIENTEKIWDSFFHISTDVVRKGTLELVELWGRHPEWPTLVIKMPKRSSIGPIGQNVTVIDGYLPYEELAAMQNRYGLHLCPSRSEGWGHTLVEAMSTGSIVVTTDAPPMNEVVTSATGKLVPYARTEPRQLGTDFIVDVDALETTIAELIDMPIEIKRELGQLSRNRYFQLDQAFRERFAQAIESIAN